MEKTKELLEAITQSDVQLVVFNSQGQWQYFGYNFEPINFTFEIDVSLLESACDSIDYLPAVFEF